MYSTCTRIPSSACGLLFMWERTFSWVHNFRHELLTWSWVIFVSCISVSLSSTLNWSQDLSWRFISCHVCLHSRIRVERWVLSLVPGEADRWHKNVPVCVSAHVCIPKWARWHGGKRLFFFFVVFLNILTILYLFRLFFRTAFPTFAPWLTPDGWGRLIGHTPSPF